jgi:hypothetical protein
MGDRKTDIVLQDEHRSLAFWLMDGAKLKTGIMTVQLDNGWEIVGTGDFDLDQQTDLLLGHDDSRLAFWFMDGLAIREGIIPFGVPVGWNLLTVR